MQNRLRQPAADQQEETFLIIYNYRNPKKQPTQTKRIPHDYSQDKKSIILTRKMKAELYDNSKSVNNQYVQQVQKNEQQEIVENLQENSQFFNQNELERGIPLIVSEDRDIPYNRIEVTWTSNYSKLERNQFGMNFSYSCNEQDEEEI